MSQDKQGLIEEIKDWVTKNCYDEELKTWSDIEINSFLEYLDTKGLM